MSPKPNFADRLMAALTARGSRLCVGLDPRAADLPGEAWPSPTSTASPVAAVRKFCGDILDAAAPFAVAAKLQAAFFEALGPGGMALFFDLAAAARKLGLITIADVKRSDIGSTAEAYAHAYLSSSVALEAYDAITVNAYFGFDSVAPFVVAAGEGAQGIFVVVRSSNPSAHEIQDLHLSDSRLVHEAVAELVRDWGHDLVGDSGYSSIGAVVGATAPHHLASLRVLMPEQPLLVPGYGAQGAGPQDVVAAFDENGLGAVVNSSRGIMYAYRAPAYAGSFTSADYADAAAAAARDTRDAINEALRLRNID